MYVCLCTGITDTQIRQALESGCGNLRDLRHKLGVGKQCGKCLVAASELLRAPPAAANVCQPAFPTPTLWQPA